MDLNSARSLFTVWVFVSFILVLYIVFNKRHRQGYDDVAKSIVDDCDTPSDDSAESSHNK